MKDICSECGDRRLLTRSGVCKNRHGCEHRQFQHSARMERLLAEMDRQAWHNDARSATKNLLFFDHYRQRQDNGYAPPYEGTSLMNFWMRGNHHPSQTNRWVDEWLHEDDEDED